MGGKITTINYKKGIILFLCTGLVICVSGCLSTSPKENQTNVSGNNDSLQLITPAPAEITIPTWIFTTGIVPSQQESYSVKKPLSLNDSYHYSSGKNEVIVRFVNYDLTDNYGIPSTYRSPEYSWPDIIIRSSSGTKFLFVYFVFYNNGKTPVSDMPVVNDFSVKSTGGSSYLPAFSSIHHFIVQVNGTGKDSMAEYSTAFVKEGLQPGNYYSPQYRWFLPFIVPDNFDPARSYLSVKFSRNNTATWKFG